MPFCSFAMDADFVREPKTWYNNDNNIINHPQESMGTYSGIYSYYSDVANNCFYLHISYNEASINGFTNDIYVNFNIENSSREYQFFVDKSGFFNADSSAQSAFNVAANFGTPSEQGQEIYIGIEFCNKDDKKCNNELSFSLIVNGQSYDLCRGIELNYQQEESTKSTQITENSKETKADKSENSDTAAQAQTKFRYAGELGSTKADGYLYEFDDSGKFVYEGIGEAEETQTQFTNSDNDYSQPNYYYKEDDNGNYKQNADAEIRALPKSESKISESAKIMLAAAGLCTIAGSALTACGAANKKRTGRKRKEK